jgi:phosphoribosylformylglycinamidine cyclo-ligase
MTNTDRYRQAGVDIDAAGSAVALMKAAVRATHTSAVLADVGSFGGLFALDDLPQRPVLVASTDGVGTKAKLAAQLGRWEGIGTTSSITASMTSWSSTRGPSFSWTTSPPAS